MKEVSPEIADFLEQIRQIALSYPDTEEYAPWGNRAFFRELKGRNFLFVNEQPDYLEVIFRLPSGKREEAFNHPFIEPNQSLGNRSWVNAKISTPAELEIIKPWLKISYEISKPIRSLADLLPGENRQIFEFLDKVRQMALSYGDVEEFFPYGGRAFRPRKGQIFLHADEQDDYLNVNVRLPLGEREFALGLPFVTVPKYIGHKGWVEAKIRTQEEFEIMLPWIDLSYSMNQPVRKSRKAK